MKPKEYSATEVARLSDDSLLCGFTQKVNLTGPRITLARWNHKEWQWVDTVRESRGGWNVKRDGTLWVTSRYQKYDTLLRGYQADGTIVGEAVSEEILDEVVGLDNQWAHFPMWPHRRPETTAKSYQHRYFRMNGYHGVEWEWPKNWGVFSQSLTAEGESWWLGAARDSSDEKLWSSDYNQLSLLIESGELIPVPPSFIGPPIFSSDGWMYQRVRKSFTHAANVAAVRAGKGKWTPLIDTTDWNGPGDIPNIDDIAEVGDGTMVAVTHLGYLVIKEGQVIGGDDIIGNPRPSMGYLGSPGCVVIGDSFYQALEGWTRPELGGIAMCSVEDLIKGNSKFEMLPRIPEEWFSRRPQKVPKEKQRTYTITTAYPDPPKT